MADPKDDCFCPVDFGDPKLPAPREWWWVKNYAEGAPGPGLVWHCFHEVESGLEADRLDPRFEAHYVALCGATRTHLWDKMIGGSICRRCLALATTPEHLETLPRSQDRTRFWPLETR